MTNAPAERERFIIKRMEAQALMYLTRRNDLKVETPGVATGLDLIVRFVSARKRGVRQFGVLSKGTWSSATKAQANRLLRPVMLQAHEHGPSAFPICLFFFTMEDNKGWYTWAAEPVVRAGKAQLQPHKKADGRPIDNGTLDEIVDRVDQWYDALYANLVLGANGAPAGRK